MASNPPSFCCTVGVLHEGTPKGELKTIGETSTYFATPSENKAKDKAILLLTDVLGHKFPNSQLIADQLAANGYLVIVPDLFHGAPLTPNWNPGLDWEAWLKDHTTARVDPVVEAAVRELKQKHGVKRVGAVGYCFGAKYVARFLAQGKGVDVGFVAHPSFMDEDELEAIKGPLSIAAAETDTVFPAEKRHKSEEILKKIGATYQINLFSGVEHGFAVRTDVAVKQKKFARELAFQQAVEWFNFYL